MPKKKQEMQYRYYEMPEDSYILPLLGESWVRKYGDGIDYLHFHNYMEIGVCHKGTGEMVFEDTVYRFEPGCFTIIPPNYPHTTNSDPETFSFWEYLFVDCEGLVQHVFDSKADNARIAVDELYKRPYFFKDGQGKELMTCIDSILREQKEKKHLYKQKSNSYLVSMFIDIIRMSEDKSDHLKDEKKVIKEESGDMERLEPALSYIKSHYMEEIYIGELADLCALSETHFRRLFNDNIHLSPLEYVNSIRIHEACKALRTTDKPIRTVAFETGFTSISTFQRNFFKFVGMPTHEWRNHPENYEYKLQQYKISTYEGW
ncbi:AraC family transcriptional regulator [Oribacterium sp. WCC10]|uniref:AraC family transcriptional regulator n=1 Tax=Oribacterium sp. WCC10 TaxID=1855343 RepID=UPI0008E96D65|nr:AraC family transcriptional regulator [Oribacterium sp. WCC10]SFG38380.1 AraC-type DNA-binding protein [Oribacterium sp. WCC10]